MRLILFKLSYRNYKLYIIFGRKRFQIILWTKTLIRIKFPFNYLSTSIEIKTVFLDTSKHESLPFEIDILYILLQFCPFGLNLDSNLSGMVRITTIIVEGKSQSRLHVHTLQVNEICAWKVPRNQSLCRLSHYDCLGRYKMFFKIF